MELDPDRPLTPFQRRLLTILRACGHCPFGELRRHLTDHSPNAIRAGLWILLRGGWARRSLDPVRMLSVYDVTAAGRHALRDTAAARSA